MLAIRLQTGTCFITLLINSFFNEYLLNTYFVLDSKLALTMKQWGKYRDLVSLDVMIVGRHI